jgi:poly-gamma-glutamate synthesis protein (capsule biosynthesis protein)
MTPPRPRPRHRRRAPALAALVTVLVTVLVGCAPPAPPAARWHQPDPRPTISPAPPPPREIVLAFAGDVHFTGRTLALLDRPESAFGPFAEVLREADFAMVNLETAVTGRGTPEPKTYLFRAPVAAYDAVRAAGIDLISLANNHALDYGRVGLLDTLESAESAGMAYVGAGRDADRAYRPYLTTVGGVRLAVLGFSQVHELAGSWAATGSRSGIAMAFEAERAAAAARSARDRADLVIAYLHWGQEGNPCPTSEMRAFAELLAGSGVDIVLGTHAHTLLGDGWLGDTYVHWGLGNFLWYSDSQSTDTGVLRLTVRAGRVGEVEFLPGVVSGTGQPVPVDGPRREALERRLAHARGCAGLSARPDSG